MIDHPLQALLGQDSVVACAEINDFHLPSSGYHRRLVQRSSLFTRCSGHDGLSRASETPRLHDLQRAWEIVISLRQLGVAEKRGTRCSNLLDGGH
eukprot:scaffold1311_cov256-Pinguiococcus_pyrenoidosus.AAC.79